MDTPRLSCHYCNATVPALGSARYVKAPGEGAVGLLFIRSCDPCWDERNPLVTE